MGETRSIELAEDAGELFKKDALKVGVFLVGANNIGGGGEGVLIRFTHAEGRERQSKGWSEGSISSKTMKLPEVQMRG